MIHSHRFQGGLGHVDAASASLDEVALTGNKIVNVASLYLSVK
jgi:hypothetical protein